MKGILIGAAFALALTGGAIAQSNHDNKDHHDQGMHGAQGTMKGPEHHMSGGTMKGPDHPMSGNMKMGPEHHMSGGTMKGPDHRPGDMMGPGKPHPDFSQYNRNVRATRRFHMPAYRPPVGWKVRRWVFGERLPRTYFARQYWIMNWGPYGLMSPPPGCVWVRVGDDALLIDQFDGAIVRVVYGVFY